MSIMKTIMFPGDTEPREIQDNRIEVLIVDEDGKVPFSPDEIYEMVEKGKLLYLQQEGFLFSFNPISSLYGAPIFSAVSQIINMGDYIGIDNDIPVSLDMSILINEDKTIHFMNTDIDSEDDVLRFSLPKIKDTQTESYILTTQELYGMGIPTWAPIPVAQQTSLGMVKAIPATSEMTEYIGIDANGQLRVAPSNDIETDETLSLAGYAADAQVVGNKLSSIPISIAEDGYTEINGLRQAVQVDITKNSETNITVLTTLESAVDDVIQTISTIELDVNGFPVKITTNEIECVINWEGF